MGLDARRVALGFFRPTWNNRNVTSGGLTTATAFWSYAHSDDDGADGQIRRLKTQLDHAFKRHSGEQLKSFFDRHGDHRIEWGEEWRSKISTTIFGTTFFIPVISPSYSKSSMCREEFDEFAEKAKTSDLDELIMPILWVPVHPETDEEQRIFDAAKARQWVDWTQIRKLDEHSPEYKGLIDEMGERLANAARNVAIKPEVIPLDTQGKPDKDDGGTGGEGSLVAVAAEREEPPGLLDIAVEVETRSEAFKHHLQQAMGAFDTPPEVTSIQPLQPGATEAQKLFYYKRVAKELEPRAAEFEESAKRAEEEARLLGRAIFSCIDILTDPVLSKQVDRENLDLNGFREIPARLTAQFSNYDEIRTAVSTLGRMSRDMRGPVSAMERGFDSLNAILEMIRDWAAGFAKLGDGPVAAPRAAL